VQKFSIVEGVLIGAEQTPSPNYNLRPAAASIELLVIHNISLPPRQYGGGYVEQFFQNKLPVDGHQYFQEITHLQVSAHLFITRTGAVVQFVNFNHRAWHAGVSCYKGRDSCNDFSIGIELEGCDDEPFTQEQYQMLTQVSVAIEGVYPRITRSTSCGHSDIAPGRKTDPGPHFNWHQYREMWLQQSNENTASEIK